MPLDLDSLSALKEHVEDVTHRGSDYQLPRRVRSVADFEEFNQATFLQYLQLLGSVPYDFSFSRYLLNGGVGPLSTLSTLDIIKNTVRHNILELWTLAKITKKLYVLANISGGYPLPVELDTPYKLYESCKTDDSDKDTPFYRGYNGFEEIIRL